ncbi:hypothetical protein COO60DRAFT_763930 [Scenedesmus sp. NREL 46B-D3]|nr:hypothetical protein COO60DRAFT_763930 [Scenedesmus sp. NREL 46B-D3]
MALMRKAGLTTYYGQYTVRQQPSNTASTCVSAAAELEGQLTSAVLRKALRFGSGIGAGLAATAGNLGLLDSSLAGAATRVWAAGSMHQLNVRWMAVVSRVRPHGVLSLLHGLQGSPHRIRTRHTSWQGQALCCGPSMQQCEQELWSPTAMAAQCAEAGEHSAQRTDAAAGQLQPVPWLQSVPWLSTCSGHGQGGRRVLTAVGADEMGRREGELQLLPCLRREQHEQRYLL